MKLYMYTLNSKMYVYTSISTCFECKYKIIYAYLLDSNMYICTCISFCIEMGYEIIEVYVRFEC